ncbi:MAG: methylenetetrahydrofolate reductase [Propionibacteriaceae bacterium]|jgi:methylenetetrahydrofolate reductase (NADPH)|nr:methylenetetrahydrofolate reductase [Propionibacteriaceae bacterium]
MTIADLLARHGRPLCSFEFFPPKDDSGQEQLWHTVEALREVRPDFVSVTYGANGSQRERTVAATELLRQRTDFTVMGHLTCADQSRSQLVEVIDRYAAIGLNHILAIRGDMPGGPTVPWRAHPEGLRDATQLVELVLDQGDFCVGVAAFPDPHPSHHDPALDARILRDKWRAGASFAITQLFFDPESYFTLVDRVRSLDCPIPIIPGIMPITVISQVEKFAQLSGAVMPRAVIDRLDAVSGDPAAVRAVGVNIATDLSQRLLDGGAPGLHFFTQNRSRATRAIQENLRQAST